MSNYAHSRFTNGILYPLLLLLLLTCPMKREIKQSLAIPVRTAGLMEINNNSLCINLITKTTSPAGQKQKSQQKLLPVSPFSQSVALFTATDAIRQKVYGDNGDQGPSYLFIQYRKLLI